MTRNEHLRGTTVVAEIASTEAAHARAASTEAAHARAASAEAAHTRGEGAGRDLGHDANSGAGHDPQHDARRGDTRARIQQVALELFAEQGYDKTSLREIAERLDVTKAALYYHFKSKEDIVRSLVEDYFGQIDALIAWAKNQPRTAVTRGEILRRYVNIVADGSDVFRMLHHNQAAVNSLAAAKERGDVFRERMTGLVEAFTEPGSGIQDRLRAAMALGGVSVGWMFLADQARDRDELRAAILSIASDLAKATPDLAKATPDLAKATPEA